MPILRKILVANRGEIARRILKTCRRLGFSTVAVVSDADRHAPYTRIADQVVHIGGSESRDSYLHIDKLVDAAISTGADAVHPGYGFLAENPMFAERCQDVGLVFIGPTPQAIRIMGSKILSKQRVQEFGVPTIPGYAGEEQETAVLVERIREVGFPCLIKASAGGGGKGMRRLDRDVDLFDQVEMSRREAEKAFGDGTLFVERWIERPRHIEVQVFGDVHGHVVHLFERECSIQRRHQKIVEESPSAALSPEKRAEICQAAINVARSVGYVNAGTVEFVMAPDGTWYFLEMNTRLQVEHPVTELVTGLDLVEVQLHVAEGRSLTEILPPLVQHGVAIECRLYAEDPGAGYLPSTGTLADWYVPSCDGVRLDSGVEVGDDVSMYYDPMLAKLVVWGPDRATSARRMAMALRHSSICGVANNRDLLRNIVSHPAYVNGDIHTGFLAEHFGSHPVTEISQHVCIRAAILAAVVGHQHRMVSQRILPTLATGYRNNRVCGQQVTFIVGGQEFPLEYADLGRGTYDFTVHGTSGPCKRVEVRRVAEAVAVTEPNPAAQTWWLTIDEIASEARVTPVASGMYVRMITGEIVLVVEKPQFPDETPPQNTDNRCVSPMPGKVVQVHVVPGQAVVVGDPLVTVEAMKMEHAVRSPTDGVVEAVLVQISDQVMANQSLIVIAERIS